MSTREQQRALLAYRLVESVPQLDWDKYRTATLKAQALVRNAGLCQALHFLQNKDDGGRRLVTDLHGHLTEAGAVTKDDFLTQVRIAQLHKYLAATRETLQCLVWQCRMVESRHAANGAVPAQGGGD